MFEDNADRVLIRVAVPLTFSRQQIAYDYICPANWAPCKGMLIEVHVGKRTMAGLVLDLLDQSDVAPDKLKAAIRRYDLPPMPDGVLRFLDKMTGWTLTAYGSVLRALLANGQYLDSPAMRRLVCLPEENQSLIDAKLSPARKKLIQAMADLPPMGQSDLARETGASTSLIKAMVDAGQLSSYAVPRQPALPKTADMRTDQLVLSDDQRQVVEGISQTLDHFQVHLLDGVTGSGKTETYLDLVRKTAQSGQQVVILLPEIALTDGWLKRFQRWFGQDPQIWHSSVSPARRHQIWQAALSGVPMVVVGARSALFLPFAALGLIVVDEEHDASFKQEDGLIYQARDMAVLRGSVENAPVLLASATPSLESWVNQKQARYSHWQLPGRYGAADLPDIQLVDMRRKKRDFAPASPNSPASPDSTSPEIRPNKWLSPAIQEALADRLIRGEQSLLYLNRRGYAPMAVCGDCGARRSCVQCDSLLVTHRLAGKMRCHQCGHAEILTLDCAACGAEDSLQLVGPGVERLADEVALLFPEAQLGLMSSDILASKEQAQRLMGQMMAGEIDILIGTQLAAKGHHFPALTFVGVVDADIGLFGGDFRACERTYQMLIQVAGRAGRDKSKLGVDERGKPRRGLALIQTSQPDHPVLEALCQGDRDRFLALESQEREKAAMPPFGKMVALILTASDSAKLSAVCEALQATRPHFEQTQIYGPAVAPIAMIRGRHRVRFLIISARAVALQQIVSDWLAQVKMPATVHLTIDVDPYHFF